MLFRSSVSYFCFVSSCSCCSSTSAVFDLFSGVTIEELVLETGVTIGTLVAASIVMSEVRKLGVPVDNKSIPVSTLGSPSIVTLSSRFC